MSGLLSGCQVVWLSGLLAGWLEGWLAGRLALFLYKNGFMFQVHGVRIIFAAMTQDEAPSVFCEVNV
ncbi:hypothetical protein DPMN_068813 [Dreissena polymorpha]|uniref:Uncharacterized protein n=1 Tax=Dreissena polymorpha TaxID=45954 RepID=A0A9D4BMI6_DREPO|nr:hypothetical protein DPMN_068813 [Dreissena polymorpha]